MKFVKLLCPVDQRSTHNPNLKVAIAHARHWFSLKGFHMTSPKIEGKKLSILLSFHFHEVSTAPKSLYSQQFSVPKGSSFCDRRRLNFQAFAGRRRPGKPVCGLKTLLIQFLDFAI